ncbi:Hypothetical predicted protein [Cloeon dipterum]|uniref:Uncharacterized protein n=1 Tax=Cloeon dipterum TaxID=197152 RepID=A0A8S1BLL0_9INSE|nr:Hypothetical predicted protein [Cloeon dipterum]
MSESERKKIYKEAGDKLLKDFSYTPNNKEELLEKLALDCHLSEAFASFLNEHCEDGTAEVWKLCRQGFVAEKAREPTQHIRDEINPLLNSGMVCVKAIDFDKEGFSWKGALAKVTEDLKTSLDGKPCQALFIAEVSRYRHENKTNTERLKTRSDEGCSLF